MAAHRGHGPDDEDGFIYLVDRKKDVIITGGENIYPVQVEDFLHRHPDIKDVAVIGLPDERLGEIAAAIMQLKRGHHCTEAESWSSAWSCLATSGPGGSSSTTCPETPTGKIDKPALRHAYHAEGLVRAETEH